MTTFKDFMQDAHLQQYTGLEENRNDDFNSWIEKINIKIIAYLLSEYIDTLSPERYARFAYSILKSDN